MSDLIRPPVDLSNAGYESLARTLFGDAAGLASEARKRRLRRSYREAFGLEPPDEYLHLITFLEAGADPENVLAYPVSEVEARTEDDEDDEDDEDWFLSPRWRLHGHRRVSVSELLDDATLDRALSHPAVLLSLLAGVEFVGSDGGGDGLLMGMDPVAGSAVLYNYDHEIGAIDGEVAYSVASFLLENFVVGEEDEDERPEHAQLAQAAVDAFDAKAGPRFQALPAQRQPEQLFRRAQWLLGHLSGKPTYDFVRHMKRAPSFDDWQAEKALLPETPLLANYWLLHHFFVGNAGALAEAAQLVEQSPSRATRRIAEGARTALASGEGLLGLDKVRTAELRLETEKSLRPELCEPARQSELRKLRGEDRVRRIEDPSFDAAKQDPEALWGLIETHPEDGVGHQRALKRIAELERSLAPSIEAFFALKDGKGDEDTWAELLERKARVDERIAVPMAAAFTAGLGYALGHESANIVLLHPLVSLANDASLQALERAIELLAHDDDRLETLFELTEGRSEPGLQQIEQKAALRLFEVLEAAERAEREQQAERARDGVTLDNMWGLANHYVVPLQRCLERADDFAEQLSRRILAHPHPVAAFKQNHGRAMAVAAKRGLTEFAPSIETYLEWVAGVEVSGPGFSVGLNNLTVLTEAAIALSVLAPDRARPIVTALFERETQAPHFDLDMKACLIGALIELEGPSPERAAWLERLLANRNNHERLTAALRSAEHVALPDSAPWVRYHLYSETNRFMGHHQQIKALAMRAATAIEGEAPPPFEGSRASSRRLPDKELTRALQSMAHRYRAKDVLEAIYRKEHTSPELLGAVRDHLVDVLRYSADDDSRTFSKYEEGFKVLSRHGEGAQGVLFELLDLPHCQQEIQGSALYLMRLVVAEADMWGWVHSQPAEVLLDALHSPGPQTAPFLDLIAARALVLAPEPSEHAIAAAMKWRFRYFGGYADEDPSLQRLPDLLARFGASSQPLLHELRAAVEAGPYGSYHLRDPLDAALKRSEAPPPAPAPEPPTRTLKLKQGERHRLNISPQKGRLKLVHVHQQRNFHGLWDDDVETTLELEHEAPRTLAQAMAATAQLLGYR